MKPTVDDHLRRARAAGDAHDASTVERELAAAEGRCDSAHDWLRLLRGTIDTPETTNARLARTADRLLQESLATLELWGFRTVAEARARLGDPAGARAALDAGARTRRPAELAGTWRTVFPQGYEWVLLGEGYAAVLNDAAGLRRCLEAGVAEALERRDGASLATLAAAWGKHLDVARARELVAEAEALGVDAWSLANARHALGDEAGAARALDDGIGGVKTVADGLRLVAAWRSYDRADRARAVLARAVPLGASVRECLDLARAAFELTGEGPTVARMLAKAESAARDEADREEVARAYALWGTDPGAPARLGPGGRRPSQSRAKAAPLEGWASSADELFDFIRGKVTRATLERISLADYGQDAAAHFAALAALHEGGVVPQRLPWEPLEVLQLTRWSDGEEVDHVGRAFAAVLLCLTETQTDHLDDGVVLAASCLALGAEATRHAATFFAWCAEDRDDDDEAAGEAACATLLLLVVAAREDPRDGRLLALAGRLAAHPGAGALREALGRTLRREMWRELLDETAAVAPDIAPLLAPFRRELG